MSNMTRCCGAMVAVLGLMLPSAVLAEAAARVELECDAEGPRDISMDADYEDRGNRQRFSVEFEASRRSEFSVRQRMTVLVDGVDVGEVRLQRDREGDVVGDLNLDTNAGRRADPFPKNFPAVDAGTRVRVLIDGDRVLGCRLRRSD
jgi:hypothetical protein